MPETAPFSLSSGPWTLLPPLSPGEIPGSADPHIETGGARWREHFDSVEALARRLMWLEQGLAADMAEQDMPDDRRRHELSREARGVSDDVGHKLLRADDLRHHRNGGRRDGTSSNEAQPKPLLLRVQGPRDAAPRAYDRHADVLRAMRALSPAATPSALPRAEGTEGFSVNFGDSILVERRVVEAVVSAMLRRPLVLLAGVSGSGKTQLAKRLGKAWAAGLFHGRDKDDSRPSTPLKKSTVQDVMKAFASSQFVTAAATDKRVEWLLVHELTERGGEAAAWRERYAFTAVKSDWTEASHLWGYHVPLPAEAEGFYATSTLRVFLRAHNAWKHDNNTVSPHFVLLDEMNLSRPEHFGSDLLSAMEVQLGSEGKGAELIELHRAGASVRMRGDDDTTSEGATVPARIGWAPGVCVIGTVNVDETTFSFAPKVLDRAALLEFTQVNLDTMFSEKRYAKGAYDNTYNEHRERFNALQAILTPHNLHLAYRAAAEILEALRYVTKPPGGIAEVETPDARMNEEWDHQICHKVLPRIRGPRASVEPLLLKLRENNDLCNCALSDDERRAIESGEFPAYETHTGALNPRYEGVWALRTVKKVDQMLMRAWTTGFTSYFG